MKLFVTVGTVAYPFPRLIESTISFYKKNAGTDLVVQSGTYRPTAYIQAGIVIEPYIPFHRTIDLCAGADVVISAAGEASVLLGLHLAHGKLIFVPRQKIYHEHVDNQQVEIGRYIQKKNLGLVVDDVSDLDEAIRSLHISKNIKNMHIISPSKKILDCLRAATAD